MSSSAPLSNSSAGWPVLAVLLAVLAVGAYFRTYDLGTECFDEDEVYAVRFQGTSLKSLASMVGRTAFHENHPPLELVPFLYWNALVGSSEWAVRSLPVLLSLLSLVLVYRLGSLLAGPWVGVLAAA